MREFNSSSTLLWQQAYLYDRYGNRTIDQANTSTTVNNTQFDPGEFALSNRLYAPGDTALPMSQRQIQYDAAGNLSYDAMSGHRLMNDDQELYSECCLTTLGWCFIHSINPQDARSFSAWRVG